MLQDRTANIIILIVTMVWVANFIATLFVHNYDGRSIDGIFLAIVGGVFAIKGRKGAGGNDNDKSK
jgi:hypothetical protein